MIPLALGGGDAGDGAAEDRGRRAVESAQPRSDAASAPTRTGRALPATPHPRTVLPAFCLSLIVDNSARPEPGRSEPTPYPPLCVRQVPTLPGSQSVSPSAPCPIHDPDYTARVSGRPVVGGDHHDHSLPRCRVFRARLDRLRWPRLGLGAGEAHRHPTESVEGAAARRDRAWPAACFCRRGLDVRRILLDGGGDGEGGLSIERSGFGRHKRYDPDGESYAGG